MTRRDRRAMAVLAAFFLVLSVNAVLAHSRSCMVISKRLACGGWVYSYQIGARLLLISVILASVLVLPPAVVYWLWSRRPRPSTLLALWCSFALLAEFICNFILPKLV